MPLRPRATTVAFVGSLALMIGVPASATTGTDKPAGARRASTARRTLRRPGLLHRGPVPLHLRHRPRSRDRSGLPGVPVRPGERHLWHAQGVDAHPPEVGRSARQPTRPGRGAHVGTARVEAVGSGPARLRHVLQRLASRWVRLHRDGRRRVADGALRARSPPAPLHRPGRDADRPGVLPHRRRRAYLLYKRHHYRPKAVGIWAVRVQPDGTPRPGSRPFQVLDGGSRQIEAPSVVSRQGRVYVFTSRFSYDSCAYKTVVFVGGALRRPLRPLGTLRLRRPDGRRFCGPGGAEVRKVDGRFRMVFHAFDKNPVTTRRRRGSCGAGGCAGPPTVVPMPRRPRRRRGSCPGRR